jgi:Fur family peroxide stress response transcriptional regulator
VKIRNSKIRDLIFDILNKKNYHPNVNELYDIVKKENPRVSLATVYRNVSQLVEMGKVNILEFDKGSAKYDGNIEKHFHIVCERCGKIEDVWLENDFDNFKCVTNKINNFDLTGYKLVFFGICEECKFKWREK